MSTADLSRLLISGLSPLSLALSPEQQQAQITYLQLLEKWNRVYNLTAVRQIEAMMSLHVLDSLSIASFIQGQNILDVGSGPGLPGIPLAICFPEKVFTLLDSNGKKTRFMQQAVAELKLDNVRVMHSRIEAFTEERFDVITSRAFSSLAAFYQATYRLLNSEGQLLAMKGQYPEAELQVLPKDILVAVHPLRLAAVDGERHLVVIKPQAQRKR